MPITYIGRTTNFKGKSMWEILGNLKNFGIGRILVRNTFERYPEPSYLKIMKVETVPGDNLQSVEELRKVRVWVEKTFRGRTHSKLVEMYSTTYKPDYRLLAKAEETSYCTCTTPYTPKKILQPEFKFPPLLHELLLRDKQMTEDSGTKDLKLRMKYKKGRENIARLPTENETPNIELRNDMGIPASPQLYKDII